MNLTLILFLFVSCFSRAGNESSEFYGYTRIDQKIHERILKKYSVYELGRVFDESFDEKRFGIIDLMGVYHSPGVQFKSKFHHAHPTGISSMLWIVSLNAFAADLAKTCGSKGPLKTELRKEFSMVLTKFCSGQLNPDTVDLALESLWQSVMAFDAPFSEYSEFKIYFRSQILAKNATLQDVLLAMFLNPYFLLKP